MHLWGQHWEHFESRPISSSLQQLVPRITPVRGGLGAPLSHVNVGLTNSSPDVFVCFEMPGIQEIDRGLEEKEERSRGKLHWEGAGRKGTPHYGPGRWSWGESQLAVCSWALPALRTHGTKTVSKNPSSRTNPCEYKQD